MVSDPSIRSIHPHATLPFSTAVVHAGLVYVSGQVGFKTGTMELAGADLKTQVLQTISNIDAALAAAGSHKRRILKCSIFLKHVERDFAEMNGYYAEWLGPHRPARSTVGANMAMPEILVEIDCIAVVSEARAGTDATK
jgi:2-iminobutanoate/2-iminopropanoate deaminase